MPKRHYVFADYISAKMTQQMLASQGKHYQIGQLNEGGFILFDNETKPTLLEIVRLMKEAANVVANIQVSSW